MTRSIRVVFAAMLAAAFSARAERVPLYELYSAPSTDHFYTTNPWERDFAISYYGYLYLGVPFYVERNYEQGTAPFRRFYKWLPQTDHFYTISQSDVDLVLYYGWGAEGNEGYIAPVQLAGTVPLHRYNHWDGSISDLDHRYTTDPSSVPWDWGYDGVVGYVWTAPGPSDGEYVTGLYRDILGREPDAGGLWYWVYVIEYGYYTREQVRQYFLTSPEFRSRIDRSNLLDQTWGCAGIGGRWDQFKKTVLLFAASQGFAFRAVCGAVRDQGSSSTSPHPSMVLIPFRDRSGVVQSVGWYDSTLDGQGNPTFAGITPVNAQTTYDIRYSDYLQRPLYTEAQKQDFWTWIGGLHDSDPAIFQREMIAIGQTTRSVPGCVPPFSGCGNRTQFPNGASNATDTVYFTLHTPGGDDLTALYSAGRYYAPDFFDRLAGVVLAIGFAIQGAEIGEFIGITGAANSAFSAAFSTFTISVLNGADTRQAILAALSSAAIAYVGHLVIDQFGNVNAHVGVSGEGCPFGDQCWYFQLADNVPLLHNLAELHDPFIDFSVRALGSLADNGWYRAVTIAPFLVPACASVPACVSAGIVIVRDDEGP